MPQFEPANFLPQLVWLGIVFAILYFAVVRPTLPKVGRVIEARETQVAGDLDAAEAAKGEADAIRTRYDEGMAAARKAAQAEVAAAHDKAARAAEARLQALATTLDGQASAAADRLGAAREAARASLAALRASIGSSPALRIGLAAARCCDRSEWDCRETSCR